MDHQAKLEALIAARNAEIVKKQQQLATYGDVQFSFWAFSQYKDCPQKYIMFTVGRDQDVIKDNYWAIKGAVVHSTLEYAVKDVKAGKLDWKEMGEHMKDNVRPVYDKFLSENFVDWQGQQVTPELHKRDALPEIYTSVDFLFSELVRMGYLPRDPKTIYAEESFKTQLKTAEGKLLPVKITGRCDLVLDEPDGLVIIDPKDVIQKTSKSINWRQLVWYALGFEPIFNKPVKKAGFCMTYVRDWYWKSPDAKHPKSQGKTFREVLFKEILETALAIRQGNFGAKVNRHVCHYCPVKHRCPDYYRWAGANAEVLNSLALLGEGSVDF